MYCRFSRKARDEYVMLLEEKLEVDKTDVLTLMYTLSLAGCWMSLNFSLLRSVINLRDLRSNRYCRNILKSLNKILQHKYQPVH